MPYADFLGTVYWFSVSTVAKDRAKRRCQICNRGGSIAAHHRTYEHHGKEHLFMEDLAVLCNLCHAMFHGRMPAVPVSAPRDKPSRHRRKRMKRGAEVPHSQEQIDRLMPEGDPIVLTKELIRRCQANGSFTNATLNAFGLTKSDLASGWTLRLCGRQILRANYRKAVEGKFFYRQKLRREDDSWTDLDIELNQRLRREP